MNALPIAQSGKLTQTESCAKKIIPESRWERKRIENTAIQPSAMGKQPFSLRGILEKSPISPTLINASK